MKKYSGIKWLAVLVFIVYVVLCGNVFAAEKLTKIADNVYSYVDTKSSTPQNSYGANAGIILGRDGIVVVDTLISSKEAKRFIKDIKAISKKPIKYVINTHYHLDHTFGNSEFKKIGALIISHTNDGNNLKIHGETAENNPRICAIAVLGSAAFRVNI